MSDWLLSRLFAGRLPSLTLLTLFLFSVSQIRLFQVGAPQIIAIDGPGLEQPVIMDDPEEILVFMSGIDEEAKITRDALAGRPYYQLAMFWEEELIGNAADGQVLRDLDYEQAGQNGRLYPALGVIPAVITLDTGPDREAQFRQVGAEAMAILSRHDLEIELESTFVPSVEQTGPFATWMVGLALFFLIGGGAVAIRKRLIDGRLD